MESRVYARRDHRSEPWVLARGREARIGGVIDNKKW